MIEEKDCTFEKFERRLGREYGNAAGQINPGVRATHTKTGIVAEANTSWREQTNKKKALLKLTEMLATPEVSALVQAISHSNANLFFEGAEYRTDNSEDYEVAERIMKGLRHVGWKLVPE